MAKGGCEARFSCTIDSVSSPFSVSTAFKRYLTMQKMGDMMIPDGRVGSREDHVIPCSADTLALESPSNLNTVSDSQYMTLARCDMNRTGYE